MVSTLSTKLYTLLRSTQTSSEALVQDLVGRTVDFFFFFVSIVELCRGKGNIRKIPYNIKKPQ